MANPWRGEQPITIDGQVRVMRLTLGALAELEDVLGTDSLVDLTERFETGTFSGRDILALIVAGLRGGGWDIQKADLLHADFEGGPVAASAAAATLLARSFAVPDIGAQ